MYRLALLFSLLVTLNVSAKTEETKDLYSIEAECENLSIEDCIIKSVFDHNPENSTIASVEDVEVIEIEEEVELGFNPKDYLPEGFNPLKGKHDLDWTKIELVEVEEEVDLGFNAKNYLPKGFNALKGKHDLDWTKIELVEVEEEVNLGFEPKDYLPEGFDAHEDKCSYSSKMTMAYNGF